MKTVIGVLVTAVGTLTWVLAFLNLMYEETGTTIVAGFVSDLSIHEKEALWLQTEAGWDWDYDTRDANAEVPVVEDQIVDYVWTEYVLVEAGRWTNSRIRAYLERAGSCD
jgi:hypothetical protein